MTRSREHAGSVVAALRRLRDGALGRWRGLPPIAQDGLLVGALLAMAAVPSLGETGIVLGDLPQRAPDALFPVLVVAHAAPLALPRRWPVTCLVVIGTAFAVHQLLGYPPTIAALGIYIAFGRVGTRLERHRGAVAVGAVLAYVALTVALSLLGSPLSTWEFLTFAPVFALAWSVGLGLRWWQAAERERRAAEVAAALAAERAGIARELHDVVTHHVTAMVVQADAAGYLIDAAPAEATAGLATIAETGRHALADLRHLLGVLHGADATPREPSAGRIDELVERTRSLGQPVEYTEAGTERAVPGGAELAAYRVVQEALTNAVKHAPGRPTDVRVRYDPLAVAVEVTTAGGPDTVRRGVALTGGGRGLVGLGERVRVFGGELHAGTLPSGGFEVRARIPFEVEAVTG